MEGGEVCGPREVLGAIQGSSSAKKQSGQVGAAPPIRDPSSTALKQTTGSSTRLTWAQSTVVGATDQPVSRQVTGSVCPGFSSKGRM